jgi:hypothetical protein
MARTAKSSIPRIHTLSTHGNTRSARATNHEFGRSAANVSVSGISCKTGPWRPSNGRREIAPAACSFACNGATTRISSTNVATTTTGISNNAMSATAYRTCEVARDVIRSTPEYATATAVPCQQKWSRVHPSATTSPRDNQLIEFISEPSKTSSEAASTDRNQASKKM